IHEDEIGALLLRGGDSGLAVPGFRHLVAGAGQQVAQDLAIVLLILNHENTLAHDRPAWCCTCSGTVKKKVEPLPGLDSTQSRPPCISMILLAIAKPRPVPPLALVCEESACWNSSNIFTWSACA